MSGRDQLNRFLSDPRAFSSAVGGECRDDWTCAREAVEAALGCQGDAEALREYFGNDKVQVWEQFGATRVGLVLGPPGTGKTFLQSWLIAAFLMGRKARGLPCRVFVSGFTRASIDQILKQLLERQRDVANGQFVSVSDIAFLGNPASPSAFATTVAELEGESRKDRFPSSKRIKELFVDSEYCVVGGTAWSLNKYLSESTADKHVVSVEGRDEHTAPLFDLVCIDEASQMTVALGLMALAGLKTTGRVIVSGDHRQLAPVRPIDIPAATDLDRRLSGSLYSFLRGQVAEVSLNVTRRMNQVLVDFPAQQIYTGVDALQSTYQSSGKCPSDEPNLRGGSFAERRLEYQTEAWKTEPELWKRMALDPEFPLVVIEHAGPPGSTENPFEASIVRRLVEAFWRQLGEPDTREFGRQVAVISPHRRQNALIRTELRRRAEFKELVVNTVDKIQGDERTIIIVSYSVADTEFALREADFILADERLNVTLTRAKAKLVVILSRRLLDTPPVDDETRGHLEILQALTTSSGGGGRLIGNDRIESDENDHFPARVFGRGFEGASPILHAGIQLDDVEVQALAHARSVFGANYPAARHETEIHNRMQRPLEAVIRALVALHCRGLVTLDFVGQDGQSESRLEIVEICPFELVDGDEQPRPLLRKAVESIRSADLLRERLAPQWNAYRRFRGEYQWLEATELNELSAGGSPTLIRRRPPLRDALLARLCNLEDGPGEVPAEADPESPQSEVVTWRWRKPAPEVPAELGLYKPLTVDEGAAFERDEALRAEWESLPDAYWRLLNAIEDEECKLINLGLFEGWVSEARMYQIAAGLGLSVEMADQMIECLLKFQDLLRPAPEDRRYRTRNAEIAREVVYLKQRFKRDDADERPFVVRGLQLRRRDGRKPHRQHGRRKVFASLREEVGNDGVLATSLDRVEALIASLERRGSFGEAKEWLFSQFQWDAFSALLGAWASTLSEPRHFAITAGTGAGKTEAAWFPALVAASVAVEQGHRGTWAVLVYPRVRLSENQARRLVGYLAYANQNARTPLSAGMQSGLLPSLLNFNQRKVQFFIRDQQKDAALSAQWAWRPDAHGFRFPLFACPGTTEEPKCNGELVVRETGHEHEHELLCGGCGWRFGQWRASKAALRSSPPTFLILGGESLHGWLSDARSGKLWGDTDKTDAPRVLLADELHLLSGSHGAHIALVFRRFLARARLNEPQKWPSFVGMSATMPNPVPFVRDVLGSELASADNSVVHIEAKDFLDDPRSREWFMFIQPEVESRDRLIPAATTTIQALMCVAHNMSRRPSWAGGYRTLVFFDSIEALKRLHHDYRDAEARPARRGEADNPSGLPRLRTSLFPNSDNCCKNPAQCTAFGDGECWWFATQDEFQASAPLPNSVGTSRQYDPDRALRVCETPVYSAAKAIDNQLLATSDFIFATSSLEVGYDDPLIKLVYQHGAPPNLASFVQRKGRAGRDFARSITAVTLSPHSPRDLWFFQNPDEMLDGPGGEEPSAPLNVENYFVQRSQALASISDAEARMQLRRGAEGVKKVPFDVDDETAHVAAELLHLCAFPEGFGGTGHVEAFNTFLGQVRRFPRSPQTTVFPNLWLERHPWGLGDLFSGGAMPAVEVRGPVGGEKVESLAIDHAFQVCVPGNATRRWGLAGNVDWIWWHRDSDRHPAVRRVWGSAAATWTTDTLEFSDEEVASAELAPSLKALLARNGALEVVRPNRLQLQRFGASGSGQSGRWTGNWAARVSAGQLEVRRRSDSADRGFHEEMIGDKTRAALVFDKAVRVQGSPEAQQDVPGMKGAQLGLYSCGGSVQGPSAEASSATLEVWNIATMVDMEVQYAKADRPTEYVRTQFVDMHGKTQPHGYRVNPEAVHLEIGREVVDGFVEGYIDEVFANDEVLQLRGAPWWAGRLIERRARRVLEETADCTGFAARRIARLLRTLAFHPLQRDAFVEFLDDRDEPSVAGEMLRATYSDYLHQDPALAAYRTTSQLKVEHERLFSNDELLDELSGILEVGKSLAEGAESARGPLTELVRNLLLDQLGELVRRAVVFGGRVDDSMIKAHVSYVATAEGRYRCIGYENANGGVGGVRSYWNSNAGGMLLRLLRTPCAHHVADRLVSGFASLESEQWNMGRALVGDAVDFSDWLWSTFSAASIPAIAAASPNTLAVCEQRARRILLARVQAGSLEIDALDVIAEAEEFACVAAHELGRPLWPWEYVSAAVGRCGSKANGLLARLMRKFQDDENLARAAMPDSEVDASPQARLADLVFRVAAPVCLDGCQACVGAGYSRDLLDRFVALNVIA